jgi:4-hydroxybenzoate polyprenyltransferase
VHTIIGNTIQLTSFKLVISRLVYHIYTLYLFTASDFVAVLWPQTIFAISFVLNPSLNGGVSLTPYEILHRLPSAIMWIWLQLLALDLSNQRRADSVAEDKLNKPWRPIPSGRLEQRHAQYLLLLVIPVSYALSLHALGAEAETVTLFVLNWVYNDLDAAENWVLRNILNALGITCIGAGATAVVTGGSARTLDTNARAWLAICAGVILTTIHAQDLYDQEGDSKRGRKTMPLILGDGLTRWLTAGPVLVWSVVIPWYWHVSSRAGWITPLLLGSIVAGRSLAFRDAASDRKTFKFWALWIIGLYAMPTIKAIWG